MKSSLKFLISIVILVAGLLFLSCTTAGLQISFKLLSRMMPGQLTAGHLSGRLFDHFEANDLNYHNANVKLTIKKFIFSWNALALRHKNLAVTQLQMDSPRIQLLQHSTTAIPGVPTIPAWLHLTLSHLRITDLHWQTYQIDSIEGGLSKQPQQFVMPQLTLQAYQHIVTLKGSFKNALKLTIAPIHRLRNSLQAQVIVNGTEQKYQLHGTIRLPQTTIKLAAHGTATQLNIHTITIDVAGGHIIGNAHLSWAQSMATALSLHVNDLSFIHKFSPRLQRTAGSLQLTLKTIGTEMNLTGALNNGSCVIPELGVTLKRIAMTLHGDQNQINFDGGLSSGTGELKLSGNSRFKQQQLLTTLKLIGQNLSILDSKQYQVTITPQLTITAINNTINVTGKISVPQARIAPQDFTETVTLPNDVVFIDPQPQHRVPWLINSTVKIILGHEVNLAVKGLKGKLTGAITIIDKPQQPTTAVGELRIANGKYTAYGQNLAISVGQVLFLGGTIDNPSINLEASRRMTTTATFGGSKNNLIPVSATTLPTAAPLSEFDQLTVGIHVSGHLQEPEIKLYANPATLSQADILSYLVLGRPVADASKADGQLLFKALSSFNINGNDASQLMQQLQQTLGLQVSIENNPLYDPQTNTITTNTSLVISKTLSPRLLINYSMSLIQSTNILKIKYLINQHWSLQTESSTLANGVDVLYSVSRN